MPARCTGATRRGSCSSPSRRRRWSSRRRTARQRREELRLRHAGQPRPQHLPTAVDVVADDLPQPAHARLCRAGRPVGLPLRPRLPGPGGRGLRPAGHLPERGPPDADAGCLAEPRRGQLRRRRPGRPRRRFPEGREHRDRLLVQRPRWLEPVRQHRGRAQCRRDQGHLDRARLRRLLVDRVRPREGPRHRGLHGAARRRSSRYLGEDLLHPDRRARTALARRRPRVG